MFVLHWLRGALPVRQGGDFAKGMCSVYGLQPEWLLPRWEG